MHTKRLALINH